MGKFLGVGTHKLSKCPGVGTKKEGKCPAPGIVAFQHLRSFWIVGIAADVPPAASDDRRLYSQATFSVKNQNILNDDALHFKFLNSQTLSILTPLSRI